VTSTEEFTEFAAGAAPAGTPELRMVILDALATLPPRARVVVVMRYWADMSVEQVADLLGCSAGNVKSQASRGLDKLRAVLGEAGLAERGFDQPGSGGRAGAGWRGLRPVLSWLRRLPSPFRG
jgi:DNA-directed RNA polymerase specialized sigma24 family protein